MSDRLIIRTTGQTGPSGGGGGGGSAATDITFTPTGTIAATNVQTAIAEVATDAAAAYQPLDSDLTAIAALSTTSYGRAFLALANQAATMALLSTSTDTAAGIVELATTAEVTTGTATARAITPAGLAAATTVSNINARIGVEKAGALIGTRRNINFIEGANVTLTVTDDAGNEEVDVTIAASGGGGGSVATDAIFDTKGDLPVGTGADTAVALPVGADSDTALTPDSSAASGLAYHRVSSIRDRMPGQVASTIETFPLGLVAAVNFAGLTSGRLYLVSVPLPKGVTVSSITFHSATTAAGTPTNQWFGLFDENRAALRLTGDDTTTAWAGSTAKTLALSSNFTTTYDGRYYLGVCVAASTVPSMRCVTYGGTNLTGTLHAGAADTGLTAPPSLPFTATSLSVSGPMTPYAYVTLV